MSAAAFSKVLPSHLIKTSAEDLAHYGRDWLKDFTPNPSVVLFPENEAHVQEIIRTAVRERIAIVPSGGRTGLSGGAAATRGEAVVSLERMNKILELNEIDRTLRCEAGVVTQRV